MGKRAGRLLALVAATLAAACGDEQPPPEPPPVHAVFSDAQAAELRRRAAEYEPFCPYLLPRDRWRNPEAATEAGLTAIDHANDGDVAAMFCRIHRYAATITESEPGDRIWSAANDLYILMAFAWARGADVDAMLEEACAAVGGKIAENKDFRAGVMARTAQSEGALTAEEAEAVRVRAAEMPECTANGTLADRIYGDP